jgi:hypothetical protein
VLPRDVPSGWTGPMPDGQSAGPLVGWIDDEQFGVITIGSGSCYPEATAIEATGDASVHRRVQPAAEGSLLGDAVASTCETRLVVDGEEIGSMSSLLEIRGVHAMEDCNGDHWFISQMSQKHSSPSLERKKIKLIKKCSILDLTIFK